MIDGVHDRMLRGCDGQVIIHGEMSSHERALFDRARLRAQLLQNDAVIRGFVEALELGTDEAILTLLGKNKELLQEDGND